VVSAGQFACAMQIKGECDHHEFSNKTSKKCSSLPAFDVSSFTRASLPSSHRARPRRARLRFPSRDGRSRRDRRDHATMLLKIVSWFGVMGNLQSC